MPPRQPTFQLPHGPEEFPTKRDIVELQQQFQDWFSDLVDSVPILDGRLIEDIDLTKGENEIMHGLDRKPIGWFPVLEEHIPFEVELSKNTTQSIPASTVTKVTFDDVITDLGSNYDTTNDEITVPTGGIYQVVFHARIAGLDDASFRTNIFVNGSNALTGTEVQHSTPAADNGSAASLPTLDLEEGDTLDGRVRHTDAVARDLFSTQTSVRFMARLIRETRSKQRANTTPETTLVLETTYDHKISIWVF